MGSVHFMSSQLLPRERMVARQHRNHPVGCERREYELRVDRRCARQPEVNVVATDHIDDPFSERIFEYEADPRMLGLEANHRSRQQRRRD